MSKRANPTLIGSFVLGGLVILVLGIALLGSGALFSATYPFVLYFDGSVNGLRKGAPVKFKGVEIGTVREIKLPLRSTDKELPIPVIIELDAHAIARSQDLGALPNELDLQDEIDDGLRGQLESESFVTGILFVSLKYAPETPVKLHDPLDDVPEIPTLPTQLEAMQTEAAEILSQLKSIDYSQLVEQLTAAASGIGELVRSKELGETLTALTETLKALRASALAFEQHFGPLAEDVRVAAAGARDMQADFKHGLDAATRAMDSVDKLATNLDAKLDPVMEDLRVSSQRLASVQGELEATLRAAHALLEPEAPLAVSLQSALAEIEKAARATRALVEYLERNPAALVRGRVGEEKP